MNPFRLVQTVRATRRALAGAPITKHWVREAVKTQLRFATGRVGHDDGLVQVKVGRFDVTGFSTSSLTYLHRELFVGLQYYFRSTRPDPLIVDGGSNIGLSVLFFKALYPEARLLAFEPAKRAHELLSRNVEVNGLRDVEVHQAALGRQTRQVEFFEDLDDPATFRMSTRAERLPGTASTVQQCRLSELLNSDVDLLKLDVEGAEDDVLADLVDSGAISRVAQIVVEYHHHLHPERDFLDAFLGLLREQGFAYQIAAEESAERRNRLTPRFQDVLIHAYRT